MKKQMLVLQILAVLVFTVGMVLYAIARAPEQKNYPGSFTATFKVTRIEGKAAPVVEEMQVLVVRSTGEYKATKYYLKSGAVKEVFGTSDFIYLANKGSLKQSGNALPADLRQRFHSAQWHKTHPEFNREETICGLTAYVHRVEDSNGVVERWFAPETGSIALKTILGWEGEQIIVEAISVQFRDVTEDEIKQPDLPVSNKED